jgi:demethylmenaquinone methyltransferase/2-methoxy-6-polyprenyl-1,4-benzoquinol methylase
MEVMYAEKERVRKQEFETIWVNYLDDVFSDVAPYYDRANVVASLGLWNMWRNRFVSTIDTRPGRKVLDVCAGTNAIGIALKEREPTLQVFAIDRSVAMQKVGKRVAQSKGLDIESTIGDVHHLPFPDNHFDIVTLQFATRHLKVVDVFSEIHRVLKPGGYFHHCDMLRPKSKIVEELYYAYLKMCLSFTAIIFRSGPSALACKEYFINALRRFYSSEELSALLSTVGYSDIRSRNIFGGMIAFHKACKA